MNIIKKSGNLTMAEMYRLTKSPEIAKLSTVKGQEIEILVHEDPDQNGEIVTVAAFETKQGELFASNSRTFTRDFLDIIAMCEEANAPLPKKIKVLEKTGKTGRNYIQCAYIE